jgi:exodeoxyribonuclease V alpha subunit
VIAEASAGFSTTGGGGLSHAVALDWQTRLVERASEELVGEVATVVFANDASGFAVVELADTPDGAGEGARAAGPLLGLAPGQAVRLVGRWVEHPRYGPTFDVAYYEPATPRSATGLAAFLASDRFPGVGDVRAGRLVQAFGMALPTVIDQEPERLAEVHGISPTLARRIADAWRDAGALAALVQELAAAGLPPRLAQAVVGRYGERSADVLAADPYALLDVRGATWRDAETLARARGVAPDDPRRLAAGAAHAHRQACAVGGHMALDNERLRVEITRLLGVRAGGADEAASLAAARGRLIRDPDPPHWWYTSEGLAAEEGLAGELARLLGGVSRVRSAARRVTLDPHLTDEQAAAVDKALDTPVSVLTGGPGTGKTRTVVEVVRICDEAGLQVALCAPTGRAAKRVEELSGRAATTVHRLLEARGAPGEGFRFGYDAARRLPHDLIVADEWSMADTYLAWALARAVGTGAHLLLVGDADQLPSVGPGAVLRDLLSPTGAAHVPTTRLSVVHRQAAQSRIVTLAHEINSGSVAAPSGRDGDVFAVPERTAGIARRVAAIVAERAPAHFGCRPADVQVLAPMYRGPAGVDALNACLKERLNPAAGRRTVAGFHEGDRVVQTRNDADLDVANGDVGEVVATDPSDGTLEIAFPHGIVRYDSRQAADLAPAWCLTVHKSQGGEWPVVVFVLDGGHRVMLWRELVYTGVTRAARGLLLVGDPSLVAAAARRTGSGARDRRTRLAERLAAAQAGQSPLDRLT